MSNLTWLHVFLYIGWILFATSLFTTNQVVYSIAIVPTIIWAGIMAGNGWSIRESFWHENM